MDKDEETEAARIRYNEPVGSDDEGSCEEVVMETLEEVVEGQTG